MIAETCNDILIRFFNQEISSQKNNILLSTVNISMIKSFLITNIFKCN